MGYTLFFHPHHSNSLHISLNTNLVTMATKLDAQFFVPTLCTPLSEHTLTTDPILDSQHFLHPPFPHHRTHCIIRPMLTCFFFLSMYLTENTSTNSGNHPGCLTFFPLCPTSLRMNLLIATTVPDVKLFLCSQCILHTEHTKEPLQPWSPLKKDYRTKTTWPTHVLLDQRSIH